VSDPLTILVLVTSAHAGDAATAATSAAARRALGDAVVLVEARDAMPSLEKADALAERVRAEVVVELDWTDARRARLQLHRARTEPWIVRELTFDEVDAPAERGRTLGLTIAAIVRREGESPEEPPASEPPPAVSATTEAPSTVRSVASEPAWIGAADVSFAASTGLGGTAGGAGAELGARFFLAPAVALRLGGGVRVGGVPALDDARATTIRIGGGLALRLARFGNPGSGGQPVDIGVRVDVLALRHAVTRDFAGSPTSHSRFVSGADALVEVAWRVAPRVSLGGAGGLEAAFGTTALAVGGAPRAEIPALRALLEMGVRVRF
jgi:hypothetical protein